MIDLPLLVQYNINVENICVRVGLQQIVAFPFKHKTVSLDPLHPPPQLTGEDAISEQRSGEKCSVMDTIGV